MGVQIVHHPVIGYARLGVHTVLMYARPEDAKEAFGRMENLEVGGGGGELMVAERMRRLLIF